MAVVALALAGCAQPAPEAAPTSSPTVKPTPAPSPTPTVTLPPLAIPDCETLVPIDVVHAAFSEYAEFRRETPAGEFQNFLALPSQTTVLTGASPSRACTWAVPNSDGAVQVVAAGISAAQRDALAIELAAAGFVEVVNAGAAVFSLGDPNENGMTSAGTTHILSGDAWIIAEATRTELSDALASGALDALRTANPALGL